MEKQKHIAAESEKQKEADLRMKEHEIEIMKLKLASGVVGDLKPEISSSKGLRLKLPKFDEGKADIDA